MIHNMPCKVLSIYKHHFVLYAQHLMRQISRDQSFKSYGAHGAGSQTKLSEASCLIIINVLCWYRLQTSSKFLLIKVSFQMSLCSEIISESLIFTVLSRNSLFVFLNHSNWFYTVQVINLIFNLLIYAMYINKTEKGQNIKHDSFPLCQHNDLCCIFKNPNLHPLLCFQPSYLTIQVYTVLTCPFQSLYFFVATSGMSMSLRISPKCSFFMCMYLFSIVA